MKTEYKKELISSLYGIIDGPMHFKKMFDYSFSKKFPGVEYELIQTHEIKTIETPDHYFVKKLWGGTVTGTLIIDGESYSATRDWGAEYEEDIKHPKYSEDDFYESEDTASYKQYIKHLNDILNPE